MASVVAEQEKIKQSRRERKKERKSICEKWKSISRFQKLADLIIFPTLFISSANTTNFPLLSLDIFIEKIYLPEFE